MQLGQPQPRLSNWIPAPVESSWDESWLPGDEWLWRHSNAAGSGYTLCCKKAHHPTFNDNLNSSCQIPVIFGTVIMTTATVKVIQNMTKGY